MKTTAASSMATTMPQYRLLKKNLQAAPKPRSRPDASYSCIRRLPAGSSHHRYAGAETAHSRLIRCFKGKDEAHRYSVPQQSRASRLVSRSSPSYTGAVLRLPVYQSAVYVKAEATLKLSICSVTNEVRVANSCGRHPNNSYLLQIVDVTYSLPISLRIRSR